MQSIPRRLFLQSLAGSLSAFHALAAPEKGRAKIADLKTMVLQGPRTYVLVRVATDQGVYGIGEAYGSPAVGVVEGIHDLRAEIIGKDPLDIETLCSRMEKGLPRAVSGIEIALWDLAGKMLGVPASTLLGGRYRERVRMVHVEGPKDQLSRESCSEWADRLKKSPQGWTAFKVAPVRAKTRDAAARTLSPRELRDIRAGFENCRNAIGSDYDLIAQGGSDLDVRAAMQMAEAIEPFKPLYLENPMPPDFTSGWKDLCLFSKVPIAAGETLVRRHGFKDFVMQHGCDIVQPDLRNAGGLLESKKIADLADLFYLPAAAHNSGGIVSTMATVQWGAAVRDFLAAETICGRGNWMDDVILHEGPIVKEGHIAVSSRPGLGIELNKDVVKANLARGEKYWD